MIDLDVELAVALDGLDERAAEWLRRRSVAEMTLHQWPGPIGVANIVIARMGTFTPAETGCGAFVMPVLVGPQYSTVADLVAWRPDAPRRWWTRCYTGHPLGADQIDLAEFDDVRLQLRRTPLSWLAAGGDGACVLDWPMSLASLRAVNVIVAEDAAHGRELERRLAEPRIPLPEIRIPKRRAA